MSPRRGAAPVTGAALEVPQARSAVLSVCGRYRYRLDRCWDSSAATVGFVMLNPSTADHHRDDATIRRCVGFARRWGFGGLRVCNLFALRTTDPTVLLDVVAAGGDPVGPDNPTHLRELGELHTVVLAWGANAAAIHGAGYVAQVAAELAASRAALHCLGQCRDGAPRHPLYLPRDTSLAVWAQTLRDRAGRERSR